MWHFAARFAPELGLRHPPTLAALEAGLLGEGSAAVEVTAALLGLLLREQFELGAVAAVEEGGDKEKQLRDMAGAFPVLDGDTWQHAAAAVFAGARPCLLELAPEPRPTGHAWWWHAEGGERSWREGSIDQLELARGCTDAAHSLAGTALGQYMQRCPEDCPAFPPPRYHGKNYSAWRGLQGELDPVLWLLFMCGSFTSSAALRPSLAFLPSSVAQEASLHRESAAALVAAQLLCAEGEGAVDLAAARTQLAGGTAATAQALVGQAVEASATRAAQQVRRLPARLDASQQLLTSDASARPQAAATAVFNATVAQLEHKHLNAASYTGDSIATAAQTGRVVDLRDIGVALDAGTYACAADAVHALAEDLRAFCGTLRAAQRRKVVPFRQGLDTANKLEAALDQARFPL